MYHECSHYTHTHTHTIKNKRDRDRQTCLPPKIDFEWQPSLHWLIFSSNWYFSSSLERSKICGILRHISETTKWPTTFWIKYTESKMKENIWEKKKKRRRKKEKKRKSKVAKRHVVSPNCAENFILFYLSCSN